MTTRKAAITSCDFRVTEVRLTRLLDPPHTTWTFDDGEGRDEEGRETHVPASHHMGT